MWRLMMVGVMLIAVGAGGPVAAAEPSAAEAARLGVQVRAVPLEVAHQLPDSHGAFVVAVHPDSPAARMGLHTYDIVVAVDGDPTATGHAVAMAIQARRPGDAVAITVRRGGEELQLSGELDAAAPAPATPSMGGMPGYDDAADQRLAEIRSELNRHRREFMERVEATLNGQTLPLERLLDQDADSGRYQLPGGGSLEWRIERHDHAAPPRRPLPHPDEIF